MYNSLTAGKNQIEVIRLSILLV